MPALTLSAAFSKNQMTRPILDGRVAPEGIEWSCSGVHPSEMFWRQLRFGDFDVSEMSLSSLLISISKGRRDWIAVPVFTTRRFFHTGMVVAAHAGINSPKDLVGKRVGVPEYQQTAAVWSRGYLQHEAGVTPDQIRWFMERPPARSHGGATAFTPPAGVDLSYIPSETSIGEMLAKGELDAALHYITDRNLVDRSRTEAEHIPGVRYLFPDPIAEGLRYYRETGLLPVNHVVVVRADIADAHPWVMLNIYSAFLRAKELVTETLRNLLDPWCRIGAVAPEALHDVVAIDPAPYGVQSQQTTLRTLATYLSEQSLTQRPVSFEEAFAENTLDL